MSSSDRANTACASCRVQRKRCPADCLLAPYFPASDSDKFEIVHRIFGTCRVIKMLKDVPVEQRADAVHCMVYEATARMRDPVHGCWSAVHELEQQIAELKSQVAASQAEIEIIRLQHDNLVCQVKEDFMLEDPLWLRSLFGDI